MDRWHCPWSAGELQRGREVQRAKWNLIIGPPSTAPLASFAAPWRRLRRHHLLAGVHAIAISTATLWLPPPAPIALAPLSHLINPDAAAHKSVHTTIQSDVVGLAPATEPVPVAASAHGGGQYHVLLAPPCFPLDQLARHLGHHDAGLDVGPGNLWWIDRLAEGQVARRRGQGKIPVEVAQTQWLPPHSTVPRHASDGRDVHYVVATKYSDVAQGRHCSFTSGCCGAGCSKGANRKITQTRMKLKMKRMYSLKKLYHQINSHQ